MIASVHTIVMRNRIHARADAYPIRKSWNPALYRYTEKNSMDPRGLPMFAATSVDEAPVTAMLAT